MSALARWVSPLVICVLAWQCGDPLAPPPLAEDPIALEVTAMRAAPVASAAKTDPLWVQVRPGVTAALDLAEQALAAGRRWTALERLAAARVDLVAAQYVADRPAEARKDVSGFEAEWARMGAELGASEDAPTAKAFDRVYPAAARALAEASSFQVKVIYDAGLEYGRATDADSGLFYVGAAQAQQQFAAFARTVLQSSTPVLSVRSLVAETNALETTLLALYRPPVSIDRHSEFIGASLALKEARELDAAGLRYGALQRYLLAVLRTALLRPAPALSESAAIRARLLAAAPTLSDYSIDHTIAIMFLERALTELDRPEATAASVGIALAVADEVLPKYFAALEAAPAMVSPRTPRVTVTLVRWPFT
ncbi:MAG: hypothetical protein EXQ49_09095 [Acidobacteria bacterium]|nr:hypothetical protein [Acidobacteriota bacterium]